MCIRDAAQFAGSYRLALICAIAVQCAVLRSAMAWFPMDSSLADAPDARSSVSIALAGSGGAGILTAGNILLEAAAQAGYYALMTRSSGPQIRGGESAALLRISTCPVECMEDRYDVLATADWENVDRFTAEIPLGSDSLIVGDPDRGEAPAAFAQSGARCANVKFKVMAKDVDGGRPNMLLAGLVAALIGLPEDAIRHAIAKLLAARPDAIEPGLIAAAAARARVADDRALATEARRLALAPARPHDATRWLLTGNEASGYGAIRGGVRFVAAYPITPATELLEWISPALTEVGGVLVQAEDELASINMAIGASFGGIPSLTATSGPGLSLMVESLGLAVAAEIPVVVVDVMRVGPSTGIPTKSEQGDLNIALFGFHGDAPHLVLAPNSIADCLRTTAWAVHLAEALQAPAVVLTDQFMGQSRAVIDQPADEPGGDPRIVAEPGAPGYERYAVTESGISPMAIPGAAGITYTADGLEHGPAGTPSSQGADHITQSSKRLRKLESADYSAQWADVEGDGNLAVISFGSCTGPVREAAARAAADGIALRVISIRLLSPAQPGLLSKALDGISKVLVVEQNHSGQLFHYLRSHFVLPVDSTSLRKPGALQFTPGEIHRHLIDWGSN
jgi:2-oxoglutarate ferredoxin oxidoreductase subunit alpha